MHLAENKFIPNLMPQSLTTHLNKTSKDQRHLLFGYKTLMGGLFQGYKTPLNTKEIPQYNGTLNTIENLHKIPLPCLETTLNPKQTHP